MQQFAGVEDLIDDGAGGECVTSEAQWNNSRPTEVSVIGVRADRFNAISSINNTKVYQFDIYSSLNEVLDPKTAKLILTYKFVDDQGNDLVDTNKEILPVNGMAYAMFQSCEIKLNDKTIAGGDMLYAHKGNIQKRLTVVEPVRKEQGSLEGWVQENVAWDDLDAADRVKVFNATKPDDDNKLLGPFIRRYLDTLKSKNKLLISDLCADIFTQNEFLPPNSKLTVVLTRQDNDSFCYIVKDATKKYRIKVINAVVECQVKIMDLDFIETKIEEMKKGQLYRSVFKNVQMLQFYYPAGLMDLSQPILFHLNSVSPDRFFVVLVKQEAMNGDNKLDPFNYTDHKMTSFAHIRSDGRTRHPPVYLRRWAGDFAEVVFNLYKAVNLNSSGEDVLGINEYNIVQRNFFMGFNLQKNDGATSGEVYDLPDKQNNGIKILLKEGLEKPVTMLVYAEYDTEILIDSFGNVTVKANALA